MVERVLPTNPLSLIRKRPLAKRLGVSPWTLMRWVKLGRFPPPLMLSDVVLAWRTADVEKWLRQRERGAANITS